jgi:hypothetical protein
MKGALVLFALVFLALPFVVAECGDGNCTGNETVESCFEDCNVSAAVNCSEDTLTCPDGTVVVRNPANGCEFFPCSDVEVCVDSCGDEVCDEVVCLGEGCPCSESVGSCPEDCVVQEGGGFWQGRSFFSGRYWIAVFIIGAALFVYIGLKILKWLFWTLALAMIILAVLFGFVW